MESKSQKLTLLSHGFKKIYGFNFHGKKKSQNHRFYAQRKTVKITKITNDVWDASP